jgi:hypothetical protein
LCTSAPFRIALRAIPLAAFFVRIYRHWQNASGGQEPLD